MVNPAYCAQEDDNLVDVMQQTRQHDFYNVTVLDEQGKLRGLITR
ncbi:CBS domain-containing protein, partial [Thomasclavelia ramosa]